MSSTPKGYRTFGPFIDREEVKKKFEDLCEIEKKTMEMKMKELVLIAIRARFPDFTHPDMLETIEKSDVGAPV